MRSNRHRYVVAAWLGAVAAFALAFAGCSHRTITNLPPGVTQGQVAAWATATDQLKVISDSVHAVQNTVIQLNRSGNFQDVPQYKMAIQSLANIVKVELAANDVLQKTPQNFGQPVAVQITALSAEILNQLIQLTASTGGVSGTAAQTLRNSIAAIQLAAKTIHDLGGTP